MNRLTTTLLSIAKQMNENLITALLSTDFDGHRFESLGNGCYSMTDDESTIIRLKQADGIWWVWADESLCIEGELVDCIDWISEYLG
jgi:hypothetical protein